MKDQRMQAERTAESSGRAAWLGERKWGVFMHFLAGPAGSGAGARVTAQEWNCRVDRFDVLALAQQLAECEAGYFCLTLGQNSGHFCSPNETYDHLTGITPSKCSRRDLVAELYDALAPYDIKLMVYLPSHAPMAEPAAVRALGCIPPWDFLKWSPGKGVFRADEAESDSRIAGFQRNWEGIIREWSKRWGKKVCGWWIDGCYYCDKLYDFPDAPNFGSFADAMRAGNPDSAVCWNSGVCYPPRIVSEEEDYTAGEVNEPQRVDPLGARVGQAQFHLLSYLGRTWGQGPVRFTEDEMIAHTRAFTDYGGAVTWDVPLDDYGRILPDAMAVLRPLGAAIAPLRGQPERPVPALVQIGFQVLCPPEWGADGLCMPGTGELLLRNPHDRPLAGTLTLSSAPDGWVICEADATFRLAAQQEERRPVTLRTTAPAGANGAVLIQRPGDARCFRYPIPVRRAVTIPPSSGRESLRALPAYPLENEGVRIGAIRLGLCGEELQLLLLASDPEPLRTGLRWDASCCELFLSISGDRGGPIRQYLLLPQTGQAEAGVYVVVAGGSDPAPHLHYATQKVAGGYEGYASIPLSALLQAPQVPPAFFLEVGLSAAPDGKTFRRATLFGSADPAAAETGYARIGRTEHAFRSAETGLEETAT